MFPVLYETCSFAFASTFCMFTCLVSMRECFYISHHNVLLRIFATCFDYLFELVERVAELSSAHIQGPVQVVHMHAVHVGCGVCAYFCIFLFGCMHVRKFSMLNVRALIFACARCYAFSQIALCCKCHTCLVLVHVRMFCIFWFICSIFFPQSIDSHSRCSRVKVELCGVNYAQTFFWLICRHDQMNRRGFASCTMAWFGNKKQGYTLLGGQEVLDQWHRGRDYRTDRHITNNKLSRASNSNSAKHCAMWTSYNDA